MAKPIAVLTTFAGMDEQYSLVGVVIDQLNMLMKHGYDPTLFVISGFKDFNMVPKGVIVKAVIPRLYLTDYQLGTTKKPDWDSQVEVLTAALREELPRFDVVITHDVIFQTWFLPHNQAIRNVAKEYPGVRWIHWCHSAPSARPGNVEYPHTLRFSPIPNSVYVAMNYTDIELYANQYGVPVGDVKVIYNFRDLARFFDMHPLSAKLVDKYGLLDCDVLGVYPTRMTSGKNPDIVIELFARINEMKRAKLVFCNSYSNAASEKSYIASLRRQAEEQWKYPRENLIFTSEEGKEWELGVPPKVVRDLMQISNVFFLSSKSEGCSLIMLEAALTKNLMILNGTLPSLKEFGEKDAFYIDAPSVRAGTSTNVQYHPSREAHLREWAGKIVAELENNKSLAMFTRVKKKFNPEWIWANMYEPLLRELEK